MLKIRLDIREESEVIRFRVADNGCGMTKNQLKEVRRQVEADGEEPRRSPENGDEKGPVLVCTA